MKATIRATRSVRSAPRWLAAAAAALLALSIIPAASAQTLPSGVTRLRVIDLAAFATPVQGVRVLVDGYALASGLGFGAGSAYLALPAGTHRVQIFNGATGHALLNVSANLMAGHDYSYLIEGRLSGQLFPVLTSEDNTPLVAGQARVRFANAIPNGVAVQARLTGGPITTFHTTAFTGLSAYHTMPAGAYTLTIMSANGQVLMTIPNVVLGSGGSYTLFSTGLNTAATAAAAAQDGTLVISSATGNQITSAPLTGSTGTTTPPVSATPATTTGASATTSQVRIVDLLPNGSSSPLIVAIDGRTFFGAIGFGGATSYVSLPAGKHHIQVYRGMGGASVLDTTIAPRTGGAFSYVLYPRGNGAAGAVLSSADNTAAPANMARVRFSNMSATGLPLRASFIGSASFPTLASRAFSGYVDVPAGQYLLQLYSTTGNVLSTLSSIQFNGGQTYTLFAVTPAGTTSGRLPTPSVLAVSSTGGQLIAPGSYPAMSPAPAPQTGAAPAPAPVVVAPPARSSTYAYLRVTDLVTKAMANQNLSFYLDGSPFTAPLGFGGSTVFANVTPGAHRLQVLGPTGTVLINAALNLQGGTTYTFAAEGQGTSIVGALLGVAAAGPTNNQANVRFANAIAGSGTLTAILGNSAHLGGVAFSSTSAYRQVPAGAYSLQVRTAAGKNIVYVAHLTLQAGQTYTIFATAVQTTANAPGAYVVLSGR